jgi:RNA polymerase sigma factor (sigma-70 family)
MTIGQLPSVLHYLRRVRATEASTGAGDRALLERFVRAGDENAFTDLVHRHGPMVLGVCRRVLGHWHEAEDAFQTTFLLLVRKASSLRQPDALGPWLHGVAYRTALKARCLACRRRERQQPLDDWPAPSCDSVVQRELRAILDDAINRLPTRYRAVVILCDLEGLSHAQAGRQLGCPTNTVSTRLVRAHTRLRSMLARRGLALQAGLLAAALAVTPLSAAVSPGLLHKALAAVTGTFSTSVAQLLKGVCKSMVLAKIRTTLLVFAAVATLGLGSGALAYLEPDKGEKPGPTLAPLPPPPTVVEAPVPPRDNELIKVSTTNFVIEAPSRRIGQLVGAEAERQRKDQALRWLGKEMPVWSKPCSVRVTISANGSGGATSFAFDQGRILGMDMHIQGTLDRLLATALPHEVTHTVLAHHYRCPVPRWADEGAAILSEDEEEQQRHTQLALKILKTPGRAIPLQRLIALTSYPPDAMVLYAEGFTLTQFLIERKDHKTFLKFVGQGLKEDWDTAVKAHYGFDDVIALEKAWLADMRGKAKEAPDPDEAKKPKLPSGPAPHTQLAVVNPAGRLGIFQAIVFTSRSPPMSRKAARKGPRPATSSEPGLGRPSTT